MPHEKSRRAYGSYHPKLILSKEAKNFIGVSTLLLNSGRLTEFSSEIKRFVPWLGAAGIGSANTPDTYSLDDEQFAKQYLFACAAVQHLRKTKTINWKCNSYGLKHWAERRPYNYVSNGALILAMAMAGFDVVQEPGTPTSPNAHFNVSIRSVRSTR